jgi:uncharacterized RDD family membrane protein YckC
MQALNRHNPLRCLVALGLALLCAACVHASDLPAVGDGEHLWLIEQAAATETEQDADPSLVVYHLPIDGGNLLANKLDPIVGELMPRGVTAGDGQLLFITKDRQLITIRPVWSELLMRHEYRQGKLTPLPEGCTLVALTMGDRGPWALVQVQSRELLEQLDREEQGQPQTISDQQMLNKALGLPEEYRWDEPANEEPDTPKSDADDAADDVDATPDGPATGEEVDLDEDASASDGADSDAPSADTASQDAEATPLPAFRLIHLRSGKWVRTPLPEGFAVPREAALLIRPGEARPTLLVDEDGDFRNSPTLVRYNPIAPAKLDDTSADDEQAVQDADPERAPRTDEASEPAWARIVTGVQLRAGRLWSAELVKDQIVVAIERPRIERDIAIDAYLLRGGDAYEVGFANLSTGSDARWSLLAKQNDIGFVVSPPPVPEAIEASSNTLPTIALLTGLTLDGRPSFENEQGQALLMPISERRPTPIEGNADLFIQILAFVAAIFMMVVFYRKAPQQNQLDLPEHLVLASFGRRAIAAMIDLAPGFILAGLIYDVSVGEIVFESWPGNGIEKAFAAMRPGFVVIGVTLVHTTACEFILARSLGKISMGLYVADFTGKPAPPAPCLGRSLSRIFELFAPLMILVAVISPARQRLGDILAKTTVVMQKPEIIEDDSE